MRNLPTSDDHAGLGNLQWFTNTDLDTIYDDDGKGGLSSGAIAGIVIGVSIPVFVIFYFLSKKFEGFRGVFWKRR